MRKPPTTATCIECGRQFKAVPARLKTAKFCSYRCREDWRRKHWTNPLAQPWKPKRCAYCGEMFGKKKYQPISTYRKQRFCSKPCADKGGFRYSGKDHPNYRESARRRNRGGAHGKWVDAVIGRDLATCQSCGASNIELHAHHIKPYKDHPEVRFDVGNGVTLCYKCHWDVHAGSNVNPVNSVNPLTDNAEGNTEPSLQRKLLEGVTTRGRAYRRWFGWCEYCKTPISKAASDVKGKHHLFCSKSCAAKWQHENIGSPRYGSKASTSAGRESEDIV